MAPSPITSWQIDGEKLLVTDFILLDSKITVDSDCSHEIKRHLLPGRKAVTNLAGILKSRDITLPTEVRTLKAMVFPIVMYECESWTIKRTESWNIDAFELWCWRRLLKVPSTATRSKQSILKEINLEYSLERLMLKAKLQYFGHMMWLADSLEKTLMLSTKFDNWEQGWSELLTTLTWITFCSTARPSHLMIKSIWPVLRHLGLEIPVSL